MAIRQDLLIRQGETWSFTFTHRDASGQPVDVSAYSARMSIRAAFGRALEAFISSGSEDKQGDIALGVDGIVTLSMTAAQTGNMLDTVYSQLLLIQEQEFTRHVTMVYDLELITASGIVTRILQGNVEIERGVTHP